MGLKEHQDPGELAEVSGLARSGGVSEKLDQKSDQRK